MNKKKLFFLSFCFNIIIIYFILAREKTKGSCVFSPFLAIDGMARQGRI